MVSPRELKARQDEGRLKRAAVEHVDSVHAAIVRDAKAHHVAAVAAYAEELLRDQGTQRDGRQRGDVPMDVGRRGRRSGLVRQTPEWGAEGLEHLTRGRSRPQVGFRDAYVSTASVVTADGWEPPEEVIRVATNFDRKHRSVALRASNVLSAVRADVTSQRRQQAFDASLTRIRQNRLWLSLDQCGDDDGSGLEGVLDGAGEHGRHGRRGTMHGGRRKSTIHPMRRALDLASSIWAPRAKVADSRDFYDTQEVRARQFENDWAKALRGGFLARHIERSEGRGLDRRFRDMLDVENEVSDT